MLEGSQPDGRFLTVENFLASGASGRMESFQVDGKLPGGWKDCCKLEGGQPDGRFLTVENFQASGASGRMESFRVVGKLPGGWKASEWMESCPKVGNMTKNSPISPLLTVAT